MRHAPYAGIRFAGVHVSYRNVVQINKVVITCKSAPSSAYRLPSAADPPSADDAWLRASARAESRFSWMWAARGATIASGRPCFSQKAVAASCDMIRMESEVGLS